MGGVHCGCDGIAHGTLTQYYTGICQCSNVGFLIAYDATQWGPTFWLIFQNVNVERRNVVSFSFFLLTFKLRAEHTDKRLQFDLASCPTLPLRLTSISMSQSNVNHGLSFQRRCIIHIKCHKLIIDMNFLNDFSIGRN